MSVLVQEHAWRCGAKYAISCMVAFLFVLSSFASRVSAADTYSFVRNIVTVPAGDHYVVDFSPSRAAIDSSGNMYVVNQTGNVQKFDASGNYVFQFGSPGSGNGQFSSPQGITLDSSVEVRTLLGAGMDRSVRRRHRSASRRAPVPRLLVGR